MSGGSARSICKFSLELWQDLVLHGIRKSTLEHLTVNWNFNVLQIALKTILFVQGLSRTPLLLILKVSSLGLAADFGNIDFYGFLYSVEPWGFGRRNAAMLP